MLKLFLARVPSTRALATKALIAMLLPFAFAVTAQASQPMGSEEKFGDYVVYSSAFNSTFLTPDIAKSYGIERAKNQALINVSIMKDGKGVEADVQAETSNLMGQKNTLKTWLVDEGDAKYYLASFKITNDEVLHFTIKVSPKGTNLSHTVRFSQKFYED
ncbi:DUF4426 domain-containing protein [Parendozoicomonas haliclonae]|uniref:DUF4426 domain-containing protein n=1 Tax=Parendozoicomonas haliclonae TaxID=1960125 RepID=A0A1X7AJ54_9GAMM|nr:DUF4426 domain-containing protein [Parendozoicomonas haliclonae]SMA46205.1 hypothetical protein EHSB41UT_02099 [Parendozoicomonas haliclonae]